MSKRITYLKRKATAQYHSIEGLFEMLSSEVSKSYHTCFVEAKYSGASPVVIVKNYLAFNKSNNTTYHITGDVHYMALVTGTNTVLTIHDVGSATKGHFFRRLYIKLFWFWLPALMVKHITVISEFTKKELVQIIPFAKRKIKVIPNPVPSSFGPSPFVFNRECPSILCIGTKPNKNLERIFKAVEGLPCSLNIIGVLSEAQNALLRKYNINHTNSYNISSLEMLKAYQACDVLCFPSTYEGFGMPIIEAQATGRPVITSNFGAMLEVAEKSACLVDPYSPNAIKEAIEKVISDDNYREGLIQKGLNNVKRFQLKTVASQYMAIYEDLG